VQSEKVKIQRNQKYTLKKATCLWQTACMWLPSDLSVYAKY